MATPSTHKFPVQSYRRKIHLNHHVKMVHRKELLRCGECDFTTTRHETLKKHRNTHQGWKL